MTKRRLYALLAILAVMLVSCKSGTKTTAKKPANGTPSMAKNAAPPKVEKSENTPYKTPEEEARTFDIRDGYKLELVLSDPVIKDPVAIVFDGDGRMYVAEMRTYMQDIDGKNQMAPKSRVSLHWSSKHNGVYDKHTIFADNLVLPRMILPLADGVLINETDTDDIYLYRDTKGTGVADQKTLWHKGGSRGGNLEHQASGLIWDIDNWLYTTVNAYRLRLKGTNILQEGTGANMGQWGLCQDDYGKTWFINAGYESGPVNFQIPIVYGESQNVAQHDGDWPVVWPLVGLADYQGGLMRVRPDDKTLNHFTGTCGDEIYRGDRLPADLRGDILFGEPVGRLVRRGKIVDKEGFTTLSNAYTKTEFIRSTDPNFRPVNIANAPDGTLYIVDMYRGVIQESAWVNQGSYLRDVVQKYNLDKNFGRGRIWRLVHPGYTPGPQPHMLDETPAELAKYIEHPNGWWRDTAQKLLVLKGDKSVAPALIKMVRSNTNHVVRIQALWTLEGLGALEPSLIREKLKDENPMVRCAAIRASETLYKAGDHSLVLDLTALVKDPSADVVIQLALTADMLKWPDWDKLVKSIVDSNKANGVQILVKRIVPAPPPPVVTPRPGENPGPPAVNLTVAEKKLLSHGEEIYKELCFACHGMDGKGTPLAGAKPGTTMAPPLSGSKTATGLPDAVISVVLKGLSGPVNGRTYDAQMVPMQNGDDDWIASVTSYVRNSYGNHCSFITTNDVARIRAALKPHANPWTLAELTATLPQPMEHRSEWKLTASNNGGSLSRAIDGNLRSRYDTATPQKPGMWVQVELPEISEVCGVILDSAEAAEDFPQGYKVQLSDDGKNWGKEVATGHGTCACIQIIFPTEQAKFIRITQTGSHPARFWSIAELQVLQPPGAHRLQIALTDKSKNAASIDPFDVDPLAIAPPQKNETKATEPTVSSSPSPPTKPQPSNLPQPAPPPPSKPLAPASSDETSEILQPPPLPPLPPGFTPGAAQATSTAQRKP